MKTQDATSVLERQLLLQFGDRLRRLRKTRQLSMVDVARHAGVSRTTLSAIESGDPGPSIGNYLRIMSVLAISSELALLAGDALDPAPSGTAGARSKRARPAIQVTVTADESLHQIQDLQSLALHEAAVARVRDDPAMLLDAKQTLERWVMSGQSRSANLWQEWRSVLEHGRWSKVLGRTRRAKALRQASPLTAVLPAAVREEVLAEVAQLRSGVILGGSASQDVVALNRSKSLVAAAP